jgi:hypothetical protein
MDCRKLNDENVLDSLSSSSFDSILQGVYNTFLSKCSKQRYFDIMQQVRPDDSAERRAFERVFFQRISNMTPCSASSLTLLNFARFTSCLADSGGYACQGKSCGLKNVKDDSVTSSLRRAGTPWMELSIKHFYLYRHPTSWMESRSQ